jgi:hypothetical protein
MAHISLTTFLLAAAFVTAATTAHLAGGGGCCCCLTVEPCRPDLENQSWSLAGGVLELSGSGRCAEYGGDGVPLVLRPCNANSSGQRWAWVEAHGAIELAALPPGSTSPACVDIRYSGDVGGYYPCHYTVGLPANNEGWARGAGGRITTTVTNGWHGNQWRGFCLTAPGPPPPPPPPPPDLSSGLNIWPIPRGEERASGPPLPLAPSFRMTYNGTSAVLKAAMTRYSRLIENRSIPFDNRAGEAGALTALTLSLGSHDDNLTHWAVNESYALAVEDGAASLRAPTAFGALRGLETFYQLLGAHRVSDGHAAAAEPPQKALPRKLLALPHTTIAIQDTPAYQWRSIMIDTGRRLFPLPFVKSIIDAMAIVKLNVLQLHLNDMGRFAWESKVFPEL